MIMQAKHTKCVALLVSSCSAVMGTMTGINKSLDICTFGKCAKFHGLFPKAQYQ